MTTAIVIPWQDQGCEYRQAALAHVLTHLGDHHPNWPVVLGELAAGVPWCKGAAVSAALAVTDAERLAIIDADVLVPPAALEAAADAVAAGEKWAMPHAHVRRLTEEATAVVLAGGTDCRHVRYHRGHPCGGILVIDRDTYLDAGGFDPAFTRWGGEDDSLGFVLNGLHGRPWRGSVDLIHLWHPYVGHERAMAPDSRALRQRYRDASKCGPGHVRALLAKRAEVTV